MHKKPKLLSHERGEQFTLEEQAKLRSQQNSLLFAMQSHKKDQKDLVEFVRLLLCQVRELHNRVSVLEGMHDLAGDGIPEDLLR